MRRGLPRPWQWEDRNNDWYITIKVAGKRKQKFVAANGTPIHEVNKQVALTLAKAHADTGQTAKKMLLFAIMEKFLEHVQVQFAAKQKDLPEAVRTRKAKAKQTFRVRRTNLRSFAEHLAESGQERLAAEELRPLHVSQWLAKHSWGPGQVRTVITSLQR